MSADSSYIIIGAGVFGVSTALRLIQTKPSAQIHLIDKGSLHRESASWDWSKIIRADYTDILYCRLALEAREAWRKDPLYSEFYHETGLIWVDETGFSENVVTNYAALGVNEKLRMVPVQTLREIEGGLFKDADFGTKDIVYVNDCSGWVEAYKALARITEAAAKAGVILVESKISRLTFDGKGNCTGAQSADGRTFLAENIILATGAETARLLVESAPNSPELHAGDRLLAAGLITGVVRLDPGEAARHRAAPAFLHAEGSAKGTLRPRHCAILFAKLAQGQLSHRILRMN